MIVKEKWRLNASNITIMQYIFILLIALVLITPLCGFVFQCGCDWPWSGLDEKCNFHRNIQPSCPWCVSYVTGFLATVFAIMAGLWASSVNHLSGKTEIKIINWFVDVFIGVLVFVLTATTLAIISAFWKGYPLSIDIVVM